MKGRLLGAIAFLCFSQNAGAEVIQYHPNSPAYLNGNFDPSRLQSAYLPCLETVPIKAIDVIGGGVVVTPGGGAPNLIIPAVNTQFFIKTVSNRRELYNYLNVSASISGSYGFFSGDAAVSLERETNFDENTFSWIVYGYSSYGRFVMAEQPKLTQRAMNLSSNSGAFRNLCGTDYVSQEVRAVLAAAVFKIRNLSTSQRQVLTASISGGFNNGILDISASANYQNFVKEAAKYGQIEVSFYALGGPGVPALAPIATQYENPQLVIATLQNYFSTLTFQNSVPVSYTTGSMQSLISKPNIETEFYNRFIADLYLEYENLGATRLKLQDISRRKKDFELSDADFDKLNAEVVVIDNIRRSILKKVSACRDAYIDFAVVRQKRRTACTSDTEFVNFSSRFSGLSSKPYQITYWTGNSAQPGEEYLNFEVTSSKLSNVTIMKGLNSPSPTPINNVPLSVGTDGVKRAGDIIILKDIAISDFPIGLTIQMNSGTSYTEKFIATLSPILGQLATLTPPLDPLAVGITNAISPLPQLKTEDMQKALRDGLLVPPTLKEPTIKAPRQ